MGELRMDAVVALDEMDKGVTGLHDDHEESLLLGESTFIVPFFNCFYYFLLVPFKITLDPVTNRYSLKSCKANRILCGMAHVLVFFMFAYTIVVGIIFFVINDQPGIVLGFHVTNNFSALIAFGIIMNMMWRRQKDFLQVVQWTRLPRQHLLVHKGVVSVGILIYATLFVMFVFMSILNWVIFKKDSYLSLLALFEVVPTEHEESSGVFSGNETDKIERNGQQKTSVLHGIILGLIVYMSMFYLTIQGILLALTLTLRQLGKHFSVQMDKYKNITNANEQYIEQGIKCYRDLKNICEGIHRVYGNHLMAYYVISVSYYAEAPHILLGKLGEMERVVLAYFVASGGVWILAAEFHHHVRKAMQRWIRLHTDSKWITLEDRLKLLAISNEISCDPISLSSKYFRVTYSHIGTMVGLILTYGIIVCQLYHDMTSS